MGVCWATPEVAVEDLPRVENHAGRPEVRAALAGRVGRDLRTSATIGQSLLYVALPIADGGRTIGVIRVALPLLAGDVIVRDDPPGHARRRVSSRSSSRSGIGSSWRGG